MAVTVEDLETAARIILRDESEDMFSSEQLAQAIASAVSEYSRHRPWQRHAADDASTENRKLDLDNLGALGDYLDDPTAAYVVAVEYPVDQYPPQFLRFSRWDNILALDVDAEIVDATVRLYWREPHQLDTDEYPAIPADHINPLAEGTAGYALQAYAAASSQLLTLQPREAERLRQLAAEHLAHFRAWLPSKTASQGVLFRPADAVLQRDVVSWPHQE